MPSPCRSLLVVSAAVLPFGGPALGQVRLDRADPTISENALPHPAPPPAPARAVLTPPAVDPDRVAPPARPLVAQAIAVTPGELPPEAFASVIVHYVGRPLDRAELGRLAADIAGVARHRGYPLATAAIPAQALAGGVLHVALDYGRIDAVRILGTINPHADRLLTRALATGRAVRQADLERAILLIGDMPGLRVVDSRLTRQNGFGILLVTVALDRASAYVQLDNRGTREVGPIRSTVLASLRGIATAGDEAAVLVSNTPTQPREFAFVRGRYSLPVLSGGELLSFSASYGRAHPGASLKPLDVIGHSVDGAVSLAKPLLRSRRTSLLGTIEFRHLATDQSLAGLRLRKDRLDTLTGTLDGATRIGGGTLRGQLALAWGLPLPGVSRAGDPMISRGDGDARFVLGSFIAEWVRPLGGRWSVALGAAGQLASRPLLATMELGAGGPAFGRAYDYSERTGDDGALGSAELRAALPALEGHILKHPQLYAFADGGSVWNLRGGLGGGALASAGGGTRFGVGGFEVGVEAAQPLTDDRLATGDRSPRISFRVARLL